jgi:DNA-binding transcriptional ArsR family regulator
LLDGDSKGRILDQSLLLGRLEFTVSTIADGTDLTYRTVKEYLKRLEKNGFVLRTRKMGNAQAYRFAVENHMSGLLQWAIEFQSTRKKT